MSNRPEWVYCIERKHVDHKGKSWCGKRVFGFLFVDVSHAAENGAQQGRLVACRECAHTITVALQNGHDDPEYSADGGE